LKISQKRQWKLFEYPLYVVGLSLFPPLALYALNLGEAPLSSLWRPVGFSFLFGLLVFGIIFIFNRKLKVAGLIAVSALIPVYFYGHLYLLLKNKSVFGLFLGRHSVFFPIFMFGFILLIGLFIKGGRDLLKLHQILNFLFLSLIVFQLVLIIPYEVQSAFAHQRQKKIGIEYVEQPSANQPRDIYLIVLDSYMRSDWLLENLDVNNDEFIQALESLGFTVGDCSRSNYSYTLQSMTSELNMNYLVDLDLQMNNLDLSAALKNSAVRKVLENEDYDFVFFETGYPWIEMTDADRFIALDETADWNAFEVMFLETTLFKIPYDYYLENAVDLSIEDRLIHDRAVNINKTLNQLNPSLRNDAPMFVYAHIISPHPPYLFTSNGNINYDWEQDPRASARLTYEYLNMRMIEVLSTIISESEIEPIIILQSDHGDGEGGYRNLILNAYYLPDGGSASLYPAITPVNTFRLIFNHYFGMDYSILDDLGYYSPDDDRYHFEIIEDPYDRCR